MGYMLEIQNIHKTFNPGTVNEKKALSHRTTTRQRFFLSILIYV